MTRRAILQIGTEKTGTTTLQVFLARNRDRLAARGVHYPRFCGSHNHTGLAAYAMDECRGDPLRHEFGIPTREAIPAFRARFELEAAAELGLPGTVIFCNEHCHSRLQTPAEVARLHGLLAPHFDRIDVSVYLRRQDQIALSLYSTRLKSGGTDLDILPGVNADDPYFNYDAFLRLWEDAFGRDHVHVRLFDRRELVAGDIVADFLAAWDLGSPEDYTPVGKLNESISAEAQDYLRRVNAHLAPTPGLPRDAVQGPLAAQLARLFPGKGARPARADAAAFYDRFRASNAAVAARHFPGRPTLFNDSFEDYPETAERLVFGPDEMAVIAARLHAEQAREIRRLEAEIQIRECRLAWERGQPEAAIAAVRRAIGLLPTHAEGHRVLAEFLHRSGRRAETVEPARRAAELHPERHDYWHFLGVALRGTGDLAGAATAQERSLDLDPSHEPSRRALDSIRAEQAATRAAG